MYQTKSHEDAMPFNEKIINERNGDITALLEIMRALRDPETGCPWDIEQTFDSISPYTIEEARSCRCNRQKRLGQFEKDLETYCYNQSIIHR